MSSIAAENGGKGGLKAVLWIQRDGGDRKRMIGQIPDELTVLHDIEGQS